MIRVLVVAAVAALALTALPAQGAARKSVLEISTAPGAALKFSTRSLKAKAGVVTIVMRNRSFLPHDIAIKGHGVNAKGRTVPKGGTSTVTARLKAGRYEFYCSVPGHEAAGMKGTLTIT